MDIHKLCSPQMDDDDDAIANCMDAFTLNNSGGFIKEENNSGDSNDTNDNNNNNSENNGNNSTHNNIKCSKSNNNLKKRDNEVLGQACGCLLCTRGSPVILNVDSPSWISISRVIFFVLHILYPQYAYLHVKTHIYPFVKEHWDLLSLPKKDVLVEDSRWKKHILDALCHGNHLFESGHNVYQQSGYWLLKSREDPWSIERQSLRMSPRSPRDNPPRSSSPRDIITPRYSPRDNHTPRSSSPRGEITPRGSPRGDATTTPWQTVPRASPRGDHTPRSSPRGETPRSSPRGDLTNSGNGINGITPNLLTVGNNNIHLSIAHNNLIPTDHINNINSITFPVGGDWPDPMDDTVSPKLRRLSIDEGRSGILRRFTQLHQPSTLTRTRSASSILPRISSLMEEIDVYHHLKKRFAHTPTGSPPSLSPSPSPPPI